VVERFLNRIGKFDPAATRGRYAEAALGHAPRCACEGCANFELVRPGLFPASFLALLDALGIDPAKEYEAHYLAPLEGAMSLYVGMYAFIAHREDEPEPGGWRADVFEPVAPGAFAAFSSWPDAPPPWPAGGTARLDFLLVLPWVAGSEPPAPMNLGCAPRRSRKR
jgi:hypothetical protein